MIKEALVDIKKKRMVYKLLEEYPFLKTCLMHELVMIDYSLEKWIVFAQWLIANPDQLEAFIAAEKGGNHISVCGEVTEITKNFNRLYGNNCKIDLYD